MTEANINRDRSGKSNSYVALNEGKLQHHFSSQLEPTLSPIESWGFGLSGLLLWLGTAPSMHAQLGPKAIFVWLPGTIVGILLNLQVKRLGIQWPQMSGGTPNYTAKLLKKYPRLAVYSAIGYLVGWVSVVSMNAIILTDLIQATLAPLDIYCPVTLLKIGFTSLPFLVAFSGTRALGILHSCFVFPAIGLLLAFCIQGIGWLSFEPSSPGLFPSHLWETTNITSLNFIEWAKWFFIAVYAVCGCETASSFVADSRNPKVTLRCLEFAAWLIFPVYICGSWVLTCLATDPAIGNNTYLNLVTAALPFWGKSASFLVTFLIACGCLLSSATAVSNCPRILYQLALDKYVSPVFAVVSRRGVFGPGLTFTLSMSLLCLIWGDIDRIVMVTGTAYLASIIFFHFGLWLNRGKSKVLWPYWSGVFCAIELAVLVVGGLAWKWKDLPIGLLLPIAILVLDTSIGQVDFPPFHVAWWRKRYQFRSEEKILDFILVQVTILILLICGATSIGWVARAVLDSNASDNYANVFVLLLLISAFVGVAIACWTSLPQIATIIEAREQAEHLFNIAIDAIVVLDEEGTILQANPAAEDLFGIDRYSLVGYQVQELFVGLSDRPEYWYARSEQTLIQPDRNLRLVELAISGRNNCGLPEYVVLLRDITERKQAEQELYQALQTKEILAAKATAQAQELSEALQELKQTQSQLIQTEKMSSLGLLVAGVAHEINNPVNFIYGNLQYAHSYTQDLLDLVALYQHYYPKPTAELQEKIEEKELDFLVTDFPKLLDSMKIGADRIREIVLSLRNFSRLDEADKKAVDIHEGIESTLMILRHRLKALGDRPAIQVIKKYSELPQVECYPGQLNQVFMNLITNAIDALELGRKSADSRLPTITIITEIIDSQNVKIRIKDNGPGMSDEVRAKLFDPFFTTKPIGKGTGLGLAISYKIVVEKHGGQLNCLSRLGSGAEFTIEIPIRQ